jgi:poly-beta-1,6-N-acetyl-D-glucosamine synthase
MLGLEILFWAAVALILQVYVAYPIGIYLKSRYQGEAPPRDVGDQEPPIVTVLIPAYNEEQGIGRKIENTLALQYPTDRLQILVASDGSTDKTVAIAQQYADRGVEVYHCPGRRGKMQTENCVVPSARGDIILVTDASAQLSSDALLCVTRHFADPRVGCVSGARVCLPTSSSASDGEGLYWRYESWIKQSEGRLGTCLGADGQLMAVRKSLFPHIPDCNDDFYVPMKILIATNHKVHYEPGAKAWIAAAANLRSELRRKVRTNVSFFRNLPYLKAALNPLESEVWWRFFCHHVLRKFVPFAMVTSFLLSMLLLNVGTIYNSMAVAQCLFYAAAALGLLTEQRGVHFRIFYAPFYFVFANVAVLLAWVHWLQRKNYLAWSTTDRILPHLASADSITPKTSSTMARPG